MMPDLLFFPSVTPPSNGGENSCYFIFRGNHLLIDTKDGAPAVSCLNDATALGLTAVRQYYIGYTNKKTHYYAIEVSQETEPPPGMAFRNLRTLLTRDPESQFWIAGRAFQIIDWDRTHQFCGRCGAKTKMMASERAKKCPDCGLIKYPHISPAMIVCVTKNTEAGEEILLARSHRHPAGFYSVLAGFVEPGETLEECVKREIWEEVGLEVKDVAYFGSQPWPFPNSLMVAFTAVYASGDIVLEEAEMAEANWYKPDALPNVPPPPTISRRLIDNFLKNNAAL